MSKHPYQASMITLNTCDCKLSITSVDVQGCPGVHVGIREDQAVISDGGAVFAPVILVSTPGSSGA